MQNKNDNGSNDQLIIGNAYSMNKSDEIGKGSFGAIYKGKNIKTGDDVAIKFEPLNSATPQLIYESKILKYLQGGSK